MSASKYDQRTQEAITFIHLLRGTGVLTGSPLEDGAVVSCEAAAPAGVGRAVALTLAYGHPHAKVPPIIERTWESLNTFIGGALGQALLVLTQDLTQAALRDAFGPLPTEEQS